METNSNQERPILDIMVGQGGLSEKVIFELKQECEGASNMNSWGKAGAEEESAKTPVWC